jgi:cell division transport system permease protein
MGEVTWSQLGLVARQVGSDLWAQLWTHVLTAGAMAMAMLVFGLFLLLQENLQSLLKGWGDQIQVNIYLNKSLGATEVSLLRETIQNYPEVERARYISQEQAWKDFQAALGSQSNLLEGLPQDVLPASFEIAVKAAYRDGPIIEAVAERLRKEQGVAAVEYPQEWVNRLSRIVLAVQGLQWVFGGMLFVAIFFIVGSAVRLSILARKDAIEIMQWVGAPPELIRGPFVVEGLIQGISGAALSVLGLWSLFLFLHNQLATPMDPLGSLGQLQFIDFQSVCFMVGLGGLLGTLASVFSLRRFMTTWKG